ncbi:MAG: hypothetical protein Q4D60_10595 [Eubacteriales bacterium]|nr:hypothetical protein [Eubacteriales bacterium]
MNEYWSIVKELFWLFSGNGYVVAVAFILMMFLILLSDNRVLKQYFLYPSVFVLLFIVSPVNIFLVLKVFNAARMVRFYWLMPIVLILSYVCVVLIYQAKKWKKYAVAGLCFAIIIMAGTYMFTEESYTKMENLYKIPEEAVEISEYIRDDVAEANQDIRTVRAVVPGIYDSYIRQYDGELKLLYGRQNASEVYRDIAYEMMQLMNAEELDVERISQLAVQSDCQYVVIENQKEKKGSFKKNGYKKMVEEKEYSVYKRNDSQQ